jgi:hypothetical protein
MCQAIERALSGSFLVISTLLILEHRDCAKLSAATPTTLKRGGTLKSADKISRQALQASGRGGGRGVAEEFLAAVRPAAEHLHVVDKHSALLLCRAFYTPGWGDKASETRAVWHPFSKEYSL